MVTYMKAVTICVLAALIFHVNGDSPENMLRELDNSFNSCKGTPAEYVVRNSKTWYIRSAFYLLQPKLIEPALRRQCSGAAEATIRIQNIMQEVRRGGQWKYIAPAIYIPFTDTPPEIDGSISPGEWDNALVYKGEVPLNEEKEPPHGESRWRIMYDAGFLYVSADFEDSDLQIDTEHPYRGDALELFLLGDPEMRSYWEVVVSPDNDLFTGWHSVGIYGNRNSQSGITPRQLHTAATRTDRGFSVEIAFPFWALLSQQGAFPFSAKNFRLMLLRTNRNAGEPVRVSTPVPFLYDGHNIYGYIKATLKKRNNDDENN